MGGGATSCDQSERERSVKKGVVCGWKEDGSGRSDDIPGNSLSMYGFKASWISSWERPWRFGIGCHSRSACGVRQNEARRRRRRRSRKEVQCSARGKSVCIAAGSSAV